MKKHLVTICFLGAWLYSCTQQELRVKDRDIISSSLVITGDSLIYSTWHDSIIVEDLPSGRHLYSAKINDHCYAKPVIYKGALIYPWADSLMVCRDLNSKKIRWQVPLRGRCSEFHLVADRIVANTKETGLVGIDAGTGRQLFSLPRIYDGNCQIPDISPYRMGLDSKRFYVCDWQCSALTAYGSADGRMIWQKKMDSTGSNGNCVNVDNVLFHGRNGSYKSGHISLINPTNGTILFEINSFFEEHFDPIVYQHRVYYYSYDKKLHAFDVGGRQDKVVLTFDEHDDLSGNQAFLFEDSLYFNGADGGLYQFSLKDHKLTKMITRVKNIYGVTRSKNKIVYIF